MQLSVWAILAAPLIAGNDLRNMTETTRAILTNKAVIEVRVLLCAGVCMYANICVDVCLYELTYAFHI